MAEKVLAKSDKIGQKQRVRSTTKRQAKLDNKLLPPSVLNEQRVQAEAGAWDKQGQEFRYPVAASNAGRWIRPDPRDTDMKVWRELVGANPVGSTAFGQMTAGQEVIDYLKDKKKQEAYLNKMRLAEYLRDSNDN